MVELVKAGEAEGVALESYLRGFSSESLAHKEVCFERPPSSQILKGDYTRLKIWPDNSSLSEALSKYFDSNLGHKSEPGEASIFRFGWRKSHIERDAEKCTH